MNINHIITVSKVDFPTERLPVFFLDLKESFMMFYGLWVAYLFSMKHLGIPRKGYYLGVVILTLIVPDCI